MTFNFTSHFSYSRNKAFCCAHKSTWNRIQGSSFCHRIVIFSFRILRKIDVIFSKICIERFHCNIKISAVGFVEFTAFCKTWRNNSNQMLCIFRMIMSDVLNCMSHWTITFCKILNKIWMVCFDIRNQSRTRLRNHQLRFFFSKLFDIRFCS